MNLNRPIYIVLTDLLFFFENYCAVCEYSE